MMMIRSSSMGPSLARSEGAGAPKANAIRRGRARIPARGPLGRKEPWEEEPWEERTGPDDRHAAAFARRMREPVDQEDQREPTSPGIAARPSRGGIARRLRRARGRARSRRARERASHPD